MQAPLIMSGTTKSVVPELLREELLKRAKTFILRMRL